jgi:hypothetical protein
MLSSGTKLLANKSHLLVYQRWHIFSSAFFYGVSHVISVTYVTSRIAHLLHFQRYQLLAAMDLKRLVHQM